MKNLTFNKRLCNFTKITLFKLIVVMSFLIFTNEGKPKDSYYVAVTFDNGETHYISSKIVKKQEELMEEYVNYQVKQESIAEYIKWELKAR